MIRCVRVWMCIVAAAVLSSCSHTTSADLAEIQRAKAGDLDVVLLSSHGAIKHGQDSFLVEFRSANGSLVNVGDVKASATMPMPGAPMFGSLDVKKAATPGRYLVDAKFDMAGTWRTTLQWQGASGAGAGSVTLSGSVQ